MTDQHPSRSGAVVTPPGLKPSVAIIRGEALNPFEMQAYGPLTDDFDLLAVGRSNPRYEVDELPMRSELLPSIASRRLTRGLHNRLPTRLRNRLDADMLFGLAHAVKSREILHAAETVLPVSEQASRISRATGAKLVLTCWETIAFRYDDDAVLRARKDVVRAQTALYIAVTRKARQALMLEGVPERLIRVIPAAVDCTRFRPRQDEGSLRREWGLSHDVPVVLYVGRLIQEKGVVELVRAFANTDSPAHLVIVGNGDQAGRIRTAASALGVEKRVHLRPGLSYQRLPELYNSVDVVVAPSLTTPYWEEQFGMVLVEAMACGRPLLTTASGAIPEVVGHAAAIVEPYDVESLSRELARLVEASDYRARLGSEARAWALNRYSIETVAPQLADAYRDVLRP